MSNEINIEELERLAKAAAPGPWRRQDFFCSYERNGIDDSNGGCVCSSFGGRKRPKDFDFIAAANPSAVLAMIDRMKKAEAELENERMRLAACGVVALADTPESAAKAREMRDEYRSASCDDVARRVDECMTLRAERDALAADLAELEGQKPVNARLLDVATGKIQHRYLGLCPDSINGPDSRDPGCPACQAITAADAAHTESVNARLLEAMKRAKSALVSFKYIPGEANCWEESDEEDLAAIDSAIAAAEAQQERLLQDMHDAGREIDRVMAEPAQKAPQIDLNAIARAIWNVRREEEDRCDMELEDMSADHSVWEEASEVASILKDAGIEVAE